MTRMLFTAMVALTFSSVPAVAGAEVDDDLRQQGYLYFAPGVFPSEGALSYEFGGGMQWLVYRGLGLGFDASLMTLGGEPLALGGLDVSYHFIRGSRRLVPFVLGGIGGVAFADGGASLANWGGGLNYWFENGVALRLEVRDRFDADGTHNVGLRVGITF